MLELGKLLISSIVLSIISGETHAATMPNKFSLLHFLYFARPVRLLVDICEQSFEPQIPSISFFSEDWILFLILTIEESANVKLLIENVIN